MDRQPDLDAVTIASRQHGKITTRQLHACGLDTSAIRRRVRDGRLRRVARGLYVVGHLALRADARYAGALLRAGPDAVLSHRTAGELHELLEPGDLLHVTIPGAARRRARDLVPHRNALRDDEVTSIRGLRVTSLLRALLDIAETEDEATTDRALSRALDRKLLPAEVRSAIAAAPGRRGCRVLTALLDALGAGMTRSRFERIAFRLVVDAGLAVPHQNAAVAGQEVDLVWRAEKVALELDGFEDHGTWSAFATDRHRSNELQLAGWATPRWVWADVTDRRLQALAQLAVLLDRRG